MLGTITRSLNYSQRHQLEISGERLKKFGVNFAVCTVDGELILLSEGGIFKSSPEKLTEYSRQAISEESNSGLANGAVTPILRFRDSNLVLAAVLKSPFGPGKQPEAIAVALIDLGGPDTIRSSRTNWSGSIPPEDKISEKQTYTAIRCGIPYGESQTPTRPIGEGASQVTDAPSDERNRRKNTSVTNLIRADVEYFAEMLGLFAENFQTAIKVEQQIEKVGTELSQTYEELVLLHKLSTNMKVTEQDASFLQMACDSLTAIVSVEGIAILVEKIVDDEPRLVVAAGSGLIEIDERMAAVLHSRMSEQINKGKEALLDSEVDAPFKYDWPDNVKNIIAVPLFGKEKAESHFASRTKNGNCIIGLLVAINRIDKPDFDSTDIKLFSSVGGSCAVFIENGRLFADLKELFIGSLKALTSSIDAKDQYTRGHSERVAFISRWIAERLAAQEQLEKEQIHRIYLAGLLHDIGKIGIDEAVLRKKGKLTEQELDCVRKHPSIGAGILRAIKQMRDIVPAVLCHHERVDGKGYPGGLVGKQIPLTGKIVGLADSFDAMTSKRTYRDARTVEEALAEIEKGIGTQFDEKVARAFLDSDIYRLWDTIQVSFGEMNGDSSFAEYGTAAVGTLIG